MHRMTEGGQMADQEARDARFRRLLDSGQGKDVSLGAARFLRSAAEA
jgi:hypothetical protein